MVLEEAGLAVQLVNSSQARNLPGRPKTDKEDARWIARLTEMGMLRSSFVPPPEIRALRVYTRHIWDLTADRTRYWQRLEKLLEDALCKLSAVVSRLAGHQTARAVIEAMIAGERDPRVLAALGRGKLRNDKLPALAEALSGMRFGPQHADAAASLLRAIDLLDAELRDLHERVTAHLAAIPASWGVDAGGVTGPEAGRAHDAAALPAADRLDEIPGLGREAAAALIAEIGLDMSRFPTRRRWCPGPGSPRPRGSPGPARAAGRRGTATPTPSGSPSWPPALPRTRTRSWASASAAWPPGLAEAGEKAGCAVGRSILVIVWHLLNDPAARYRDLGSGWHARHTDRSRKARNAQRQLEALGYDVIITLREDAA